MLVDVTFDGVSLVKGANARAEGRGWFVELEQPMPVGTLLAIAGETQASARVERVVEGVGAGMLLVPATPVENSKPEAKSDAKKDAKSDAKADAKGDAKADAKGDAKADAKGD